MDIDGLPPGQIVNVQTLAQRIGIASDRIPDVPAFIPQGHWLPPCKPLLLHK